MHIFVNGFQAGKQFAKIFKYFGGLLECNVVHMSDFSRIKDCKKEASKNGALAAKPLQELMSHLSSILGGLR